MKTKLTDLNFYSNTDTVDIDNKQIGVSSGGNNREFCIGVNHSGTKESVKFATQLSKVCAEACNKYLQLIKDYDDLKSTLEALKVINPHSYHYNKTLETFQILQKELNIQED